MPAAKSSPPTKRRRGETTVVENPKNTVAQQLIDKLRKENTELKARNEMLKSMAERFDQYCEDFELFPQFAQLPVELRFMIYSKLSLPVAAKAIRASTEIFDYFKEHPFFMDNVHLGPWGRIDESHPWFLKNLVYVKGRNEDVSVNVDRQMVDIGIEFDYVYKETHSIHFDAFFMGFPPASVSDMSDSGIYIRPHTRFNYNGRTRFERFVKTLHIVNIDVVTVVTSHCSGLLYSMDLANALQTGVRTLNMHWHDPIVHAQADADVLFEFNMRNLLKWIAFCRPYTVKVDSGEQALPQQFFDYPEIRELGGLIVPSPFSNITLNRILPLNATKLHFGHCPQMDELRYKNFIRQRIERWRVDREEVSISFLSIGPEKLVKPTRADVFSHVARLFRKPTYLVYRDFVHPHFWRKATRHQMTKSHLAIVNLEAKTALFWNRLELVSTTPKEFASLEWRENGYQEKEAEETQ